jgi:MscS family membrane protein
MLDTIYLNNTLGAWLTAFAIAIGSIIIGKIIYAIIQKTLKRFTKNTQNDLDFIFVDMIEEPFSLAITLFGFWLAFGMLVFTDGIDKFIDSVFYFVIIFNITWFVTRLFNAMIEKYIVPKVKESETDLDDMILPIVRKSITVTVWILAIIIGIDNAGYDVTTMIAGLGVGGLVFALAAQDAVKNLFGGFIIFSDKPFNLNERIILNGFEGYVREIGLRSTKIETLDGRIVTMPNSKVTDNAVLNVSQEKGRKIKFHLGLTYNTTPENIKLAKELLSEIIEQNEHTVDPIVAFDTFGDFSLNILVIYWIKKNSPIVAVNDTINMEILTKFNHHKLNFAFPTQTVIVEK